MLGKDIRSLILNSHFFGCGTDVITAALAQYEQFTTNPADLDKLQPLPNIANNTADNRRLSTPHPIKARQERTPPARRRQPIRTLKRSRSLPDVRYKPSSFNKSTSSLDTDASPAIVTQSDDEASTLSEDTFHKYNSTSHNFLPNVDQIFESESVNYAEALWDHVTMDAEELCFRAGDVITVTDMSDKDWWWGGLDNREGWLPAAFVRIRVNQEETTEDIVQKVREGVIDTKTAMRRYSVSFLSKDQARTNVINEIINAEKEYVKHLRDVVEGYIKPSKNRPDMFSEETIRTIYGNIEAIYEFSQQLLSDLTSCIDPLYPHLSQIGQCFLKYRHGFEIYSEYCNNHPQGCEQLRQLRKNTKYQHFFEACRLMQKMIEIPLEGFLLTPVQKICKYPLQLQELLKYTRVEHKDYTKVQDSRHAMKDIAVLINERKRKIESIEKLAVWQQSVEDWEGNGILDTSCELIYTGELHKVNSSGWSQERMFFLFDHVLIYAKKDVLWRNGLSYKGRIDMDTCELIDIEDGKDPQFNVTVKHGWKLHDKHRDKWYLLYARCHDDKTRWLKALQDERQCVRDERQQEMELLKAEKEKILQSMSRHKSSSGPEKPKGKSSRPVSSDVSLTSEQSLARHFPSHVTLPRGLSREEVFSNDSSKRKWFGSWSKKQKGSKR